MNKIFDQAFEYLIKNEGEKYTNDQNDSGGPTKFGVTHRAYENWVKQPVPISEIRNMDRETAKEFYFDMYWKKLYCDKMTNPVVAICVFDCGVLYGMWKASLFAQKALIECRFDLKLDGIFGDRTLDALNTVKEEDFLKAFHGLLLARIDQICLARPKDEKWRKGWTNRADRLLTLVNRGPVISVLT